MSKIAYMIDDNKDLFYKNNPKLTLEQNEMQKRNMINILLDSAENTLNKRLSISLNQNKNHLRKAVSAISERKIFDAS